MVLKIKPITDNDIPRIENWLKKDYVIKWFENAGAWLDEIRGRDGKFSFIKHFIALCDETPIGFCQYYECAGAKEEAYSSYPLAGSYSLDYLIGEEGFLGKGLGKAIIRLLIEEIFSQPNAERVLAKPEEDNNASRSALLSAGFIYDAETKVFYVNKGQV